jgi:hypothetical protein
VEKKPLIVGSLCAVVLLVLASLGNVVGYQTIQTSQQNLIKERISQKELLFQTICDITNNKEIQRVALKHQMSQGVIPISGIPVLTKNHLRQMYFIGLLLSKIISKSKIHSMVQQYQLNNQVLQKEISIVIEKNPTIKGELTQLQNSECDCENENTVIWHFPMICLLLYPLFILSLFLYAFANIEFFLLIIVLLGDTLHCFWP